jgi:hypothetical protein
MRRVLMYVFALLAVPILSAVVAVLVDRKSVV